MSTELTMFAGEGGRRLSARVDLPVGPRPRSWALLVDCFGSADDPAAPGVLARRLNRAGIAVFRLEPMWGASDAGGGAASHDGGAGPEMVVAAPDDVEAAGRHMEEAWGPPELLIGHSLGGVAAFRAAGALPSVRALVAIAVPPDPSVLTELASGGGSGSEASPDAAIRMGTKEVRISSALRESLAEAAAPRVAGDLGLPLLALHSRADEIVDFGRATRFYTKASQFVSFVSLGDADHLLTAVSDAEYAAGLLSAWVSRYLDSASAPLGETKELDDDPVEPEGERTPRSEASEAPGSPIPGERAVVRIGRTPYRTEIWADGHHLISDEPRDNGGGDEGPGPYELLVAGLGSCTAITLRMYADRKEWPLEEVRVVLRHTRQHASDGHASDGDGGEPRLDRIERELTLIGELDDEQRGRLLEIADRCPVHRTLTAGVDVVTTLGSGSRTDEGGREEPTNERDS